MESSPIPIPATIVSGYVIKLEGVRPVLLTADQVTGDCCGTMSFPLSTTDRRVKIVSTLGPAVADLERITALINSGVNMARINAAHGTAEDRAMLISHVREASRALDKRIPVLFDLKGLKIRTGPLAGDEKVPIARGSKVEVFPEPVPSDEGTIGIDYPDLLAVLRPGARMLISDGLIELLVARVEKDRVICDVGRGGILLARQGVTLPSAQISGGSLTDSDKEDIAFAVGQQVDYLGLSFINDASDLVMAKGVAQAHGSKPPRMIAKIERQAALENVYEIAREADGLMVARGDLGVQLPPEKVPRAQKKIIACGNALAVPVITATQMLESMITQPMATRAETSDVANAVWDGSDAVMLSAETAIGLYPIEAVQTMDRIIREAERDGPVRTVFSQKPLPADGDESLAIADSIARAAFELAETAPVDRIVVFTLTGAAAKRVAKYRPRPPIIAVTADEDTARMLNIVWGLETIVSPVQIDPDLMFRQAGQEILSEGMAQPGEQALMVGSLPMMRIAGKTNMLHIREIGT